jgi:catechol 2,3-dioxygenase-like lactoylglutathione lyase family enzyme
MKNSPNRCSFRFVLVATLTWTAMSAGALAQSSGPQGSLVRQVDHILINTENPESLFRFFSEKLGLPVAWAFQSYGTFSSGGVSPGNVNIELIHLEGSPSGFVGTGLEPSSGSVSETVAGMDARRLKHGSPAPFTQKDSSGNERLLWTTLDTTLLPMPEGVVFFCKYNADVNERRAGLQRELESHGGGPLGIESANELVVNVRDLSAAQRDWQALLGPPRAGEEHVWQVGGGPAIRLIAAKEDRLALLRIKVKSLERARAFLKAEGLLGTDTGREVSLERSRTGGADVCLVE